MLVILFGLLILIRFFEDILFYDPYLQFFKNDYLYIDSPRRETLKLVLFTSLRFILNSGISLGILYVIFTCICMDAYACTYDYTTLFYYTVYNNLSVLYNAKSVHVYIDLCMTKDQK